MDSSGRPLPHRRGRARSRSRSRSSSTSPQPGNPPPTPPSEPTPPVPQPMEASYSTMYSGEAGTSSGGGDNGASRTGRGSRSRASPRRGTSPPTGGTTGDPKAAAADRSRDLTSDYVPSIPSEGFNKKGSSARSTPTIVANYYGFRVHPEFRMRLYSVKVEPPIEDERRVRQLISNHRSNLGSYLCTGHVLFTTRPLRPDAMIYQTCFKNQPDVPYNVIIEYVREVDNTESTVFQFYNVVVRQMQRMMRFEQLGRHFFNADAKVSFPSWRLDLWPGFQNSIRQQDGGLMLNVDSVWKVLQTTSVLQVMGNLRHDPNVTPANFEQACRDQIEGTMVITTYNKKAYKISRIDFGTTPQHTFEGREGPISYMDYYRQRYQLNIQKENQPMLVSEPRLRDIRRGQLGDIYLVPELCFPCGLNQELRSNFRLMRELASCLHMPPDERVGTMQKFVNGVLGNQEIQATMTNWGIRVNPQPVEFQARYLNPEPIVVGGNEKVVPDDKADWTNAFRSQRMLTAMRLSNWVIIATQRDIQGVQNLVGTMQRVARPLGYDIQQPQTLRASDPRGIPQTIVEAMAKNNGKLDLIFVILPNNNADNYAAVKKQCSIEYGIPSQCFLSKNLNNPRGLMSICTKMVIQMNAKQGGEPWGVVNPLRNTMVLGYDVHHAGPSGGNSIGAMCAAISPSLGKCFSCVARLPADREEVAPTVAMMFERCLQAYLEKNGSLPARIFMYRDGVGEGQLKSVFEQEVSAFRTRIQKAYQNQEPPKLTFIVVNKRLSTRFFEKKVVGAGGQFQNPRPGLVVDDHVTRPERYDFFLISQTARQGCVGPTYFNVLCDENGLPPDKIQMYTYKLCHMYYNWSGTVAVPAPCQNAHKLAFQVGTALRGPPSQNLKFLLHFL